MLKQIIQRKIERQVAKYFEVHPEVKLVCIVGSIGKTTTKNMIATVLSQKYRIGGSLGNHNSEISAPLGILGVSLPKNLRNPFSWLAVFWAVRTRIKNPATVDIIVQELGTERIGEIPHFGTYLSPDIAVLSAITPEHMLNFKTIDAVAQEELSAINFSKLGIINRDDTDDEFSKYVTNSNIKTYGSSDKAEYSLIPQYFSIDNGYTAKFISPERTDGGLTCRARIFGEHLLRPLAAALIVAQEMGMTDEEITEALFKITPVSGRMNVLSGIRNSIIIDDSYNSSLQPAQVALKTLMSLTSDQKIAVLGSMNGLIDSKESHIKLGKSCDPSKLNYVVAVGEEAAKYLAPAAKANGCQVKSFKTAVEAGMFVRQILKRGGIVLFKGSEDGIFLEEAIKFILANADLEKQLVRQSAAWLQKKQNFFSKVLGDKSP